jgi:hypothetical protein
MNEPGVIDQLLFPLYLWLKSTSLSHFVRTSTWMWQTCESIHFIGLSLLMGTVGLFDLRLLGFAKLVPLRALHRLIPIGVFGFVINALTGICFLAGTPEQYLYNPAFRLKVVFILLAGVNIAVFYSTTFRRCCLVQPGEAAPLRARIIGGVSLCLWIGVISAGRLLTFYRPMHLPNFQR